MKNFVLIAGLLATSSSYAVVWVENEGTGGNSTRATANVFVGFAPGDSITGSSTGSSTILGSAINSADYFQLQTTTETAGIWMGRMTILGTQNVFGTLRGFSQIGGVVDTTSDAGFLSSSANARWTQWYGFGKGETVNFRMAGSTNSTSPYEAVFTRTLITPTNLGTIGIGASTIGTVAPTSGAASNTEVFIYDSNFNLIGANDDLSPTSTLSLANLNLTAGQYYIAVGRSNTATNVANSAALSGGFEGNTTASVLQFGDMLTSTNGTTTPSGYGLQLNGTTVGSASFSNTGSDAGRIDWYSVQAVPEPGTMAALGLGLAALARKRRKA